MKTLDVTGLEPSQISDLIEAHTGWRPSCKIGPAPGSWSREAAIVLTDRSIPVSAMRRLINYDFCIEGRLFNLVECAGQTRAEHGSGYPGDTGTTYVPEIRVVYQP